MLNEYVQQWSAIQTIRAAGLDLEEILMAYLDLTEDLTDDQSAVNAEAYLCGLIMLPVSQRDVLAQLINETLDSVGSLVDGAHYSDHRAAIDAGYDEYLRPLTLSPDDYDFSASPRGDSSTSNIPGPGADAVRGTGFGDPAETEMLRCLALHESGILDRGAEERFDRITRQARDHFGVSSASIALITADAQIIKSVIGPIGQDLPRSIALCATTIEEDRTLVITDTRADPAWKDHPLVTGGPNIRFYAGHPVSTVDGWRVGTLCLIDDHPRTFTEDDERALRSFAAQVQIELWM